MRFLVILLGNKISYMVQTMCVATIRVQNLDDHQLQCPRNHPMAVIVVFRGAFRTPT